MAETFICACCGGKFEKSSDEEANAEAQAIWGVAEASSSAGMELVCDDCFKTMQEIDPWLAKQVATFRGRN